jgi:L-gulonate 3-dehydrogenase
MERIAIIGTGLIGRAWAMVFARAGHSVTIWDNEPGAVVKALALIEESLREQKHVGLISEEPQTVRDRITVAKTMEQVLAEADYVQESTAERVDAKKQVYMVRWMRSRGRSAFSPARPPRFQPRCSAKACLDATAASSHIR